MISLGFERIKLQSFGVILLLCQNFDSFFGKSVKDLPYRKKDITMY